MLEISLKAEELFRVGSYIITNSLLLTSIVSLILMLLGVLVYKKVTIVPGKLQSLVEMGIEKLLDLMDLVLGSRAKAEQYLPLIATIFIFIFFSNLIGILPGVGSLVHYNGAKSVPLLRSPAADLNFTLAFAVISVFLTNFFGIITVGFLVHTKKYLNFSNPIHFFVGILELLSEITRIISFSFRLFGNIFAGEVLLTIIFFLLPYVAPVPFLTLELFFGMIQAFIFAILTLVTLSLHTTEPQH